MESDATRLDRLLKSFRAGTGVTKRRLGAAIGLNEDDLGKAHLAREEVQKRFCHALRRKNLPALACLLGLDRGASQLLETLAREAFAIYSGHDPSATMATERNLSMALYAGEVGLEYFGRDHLVDAEPLLHEAWSLICNRPPGPEERNFASSLRIGTDLAGLLTYRGDCGGAGLVFVDLIPLAERYADQGGDRRTLNHKSLVFKGASMLLRHQGADGQQVLLVAQRALTILQERDIDPVGQAALLRDQAKPVVSGGLGWTLTTAPRLRPYSRSQELLRQSEALLVGQPPSEVVVRELLFTRLTQIECLAAQNRRDELLRAWEILLTSPDRATLQSAPVNTPLGSKFHLAELALRVAFEQWEEALQLLARLELGLRGTPLEERRQRTREVKQAVEREERRVGLQVLMR